MKKTIYKTTIYMVSASLSMCCTIGIASAQLPQFETFYNTGGNMAQSVAIDHFGNMYVAGTFTGTKDFDPGPGQYYLTATPGGNIYTPTSDIFVSKILPSGQLSWARRIGSSGGDDCRAIAVDSRGNIIIGGVFEDTVDFGQGNGVLVPVSAPFATSHSRHDVFLAKLDSAGNLIWARNWGSTSRAGNNNSAYDYLYNIDLDEQDNIYASGMFEGLAIFDPGTALIQLQSEGTTDAFVTRHDSAGNLVWARQAGTPQVAGRTVEGKGLCRAYATQIKYDRSGSIYIAGSFTDSIEFDRNGNGYLLTTENGYRTNPNGFLWKMDTAGNFQWARHYKGVTDNGTPFGLNYTDGLAIDTINKLVYTCGYFRDTVDFDPLNPGSQQFIAKSAQAGRGGTAYLVQTDPQGHINWVKTWGGPAPEYTMATSVAVNPAGIIHVAGWFHDTVDFDPGPGSLILKSDRATLSLGYTGYITRFNSTGTFSDAGKIEGTYRIETRKIVADKCGDLYVTGGIVNANKGITYFNPKDQTRDYYQTDSLYYSFLLKLSETLPLPTAADTIYGASPVCKGVQTYSIDPIKNAVSYTWIFDGNVIASGKNPSIDLNVLKSGTLEVKAIGACNDGIAKDLAIELWNPDRPRINVNKDTLSTIGEYATYQWFKGGAPIDGATGRYLYVTENTSYFVTVTDENGCKDTSQAYAVNNVGISTSSSHEKAYIYPNPAGDIVYIKSMTPVNVRLNSLDGRTLMYQQNVSQLPLHNIPDGIYLIHLYNENGHLLHAEKLIRH